MNGVVGIADLLTETDLNDEQRLFVDTIKSSGEALLVIINDVVDFSKIEADKIVLHSDGFDLERSIHEILIMLQGKAREKGIELILDYDMFLLSRFIGDQGRIRQILTNLIRNALKFTLQGHVLVRVVGVEQDDGTAALTLTIEDTGIGIPEDKIDHIFGEFSQVDDEQNRQFEGTGLGLAISKRLIELMGGTIWATSQVDVGTSFGLSFALPLMKQITMICPTSKGALPVSSLQKPMTPPPGWHIFPMYRPDAKQSRWLYCLAVLPKFPPPCG